MSEPKEIPAAILDAAAEAMLFYPHDGNYTRLAKAALEAAGVPDLINEGLAAENRQLLAQIADYRESYCRVIVEQCAIDEKHCTCVPALRARIARLEREVSFRKEAWDSADSHVIELQARIAELESALTSMVYQFAIYSDNGFITAGLSALEEAFDALDWAQPHRDPRVECDKNGCTKHVSVIDHGKWCGDHKPKCAESVEVSE